MKTRTLIFVGIGAAIVAVGVAFFVVVTRRPDTLGRQGDKIETIAFSPDGKHLVAGTSDGKIQIWDVEAGETRTVFQQKDFVHAIVFRPDGESFATGDEGKVNLWGLPSGKLLKSLPIESGDVSSIAISPDGTWLAAAGRLKGGKGGVALWNLESGAAESLDVPNINHLVAFSPDVGTFAVRSERAVELWNLDTKERITTIPAEFAAWKDDLQFTPDGQTLVAMNERTNQAELWNLVAWEKIDLPAPIAASRAIALSPNGKTLATCAGLQVELWDTATFDHKKAVDLDQWFGPRGTVTDMAFSPDGKTLAVVTGGAIRLIRLP